MENLNGEAKVSELTREEKNWLHNARVVKNPGAYFQIIAKRLDYIIKRQKEIKDSVGNKNFVSDEIEATRRLTATTG